MHADVSNNLWGEQKFARKAHFPFVAINFVVSIGMSLSTTEKLDNLNDLIKHIRVAMLTTREGDRFRSRPMATLEMGDEDTLWFFTNKASDKVHELNRDSQVNLVYADNHHNKFISISGTTEIIHDVAKNKELWTPFAKSWFPEGPEDPDLVLLKVKIEHAEYWDGPSSKVVPLIGLIGSAITGKPYDAGEHEHIDLQ